MFYALVYCDNYNTRQGKLVHLIKPYEHCRTHYSTSSTHSSMLFHHAFPARDRLEWFVNVTTTWFAYLVPPNMSAGLWTSWSKCYTWFGFFFLWGVKDLEFSTCMAFELLCRFYSVWQVDLRNKCFCEEFKTGKSSQKYEWTSIFFFLTVKVNFITREDWMQCTRHLTKICCSWHSSAWTRPSNHATVYPYKYPAEAKHQVHAEDETNVDQEEQATFTAGTISISTRWDQASKQRGKNRARWVLFQLVHRNLNIPNLSKPTLFTRPVHNPCPTSHTNLPSKKHRPLLQEKVGQHFSKECFSVYNSFEQQIKK